MNTVRTGENTAHKHVGGSTGRTQRSFRHSRINDAPQVEQYVQWDGWNSNASFPHGVREAAAINLQWMRFPAGYENGAVVPFDPVTNVLAPEAAVLHASNRFCSKMGEWTGIFEDVCRMNISSYLIPDPWLPNSTVNCTNEAQRRQHEAACYAHNGTDYERDGVHYIKIQEE